MCDLIKLSEIPADKYYDYRYNVIFKAYKWDPQVEDHNTISKHVILMSRKAAMELSSLAEQLSRETMELEEELADKLHLAKDLELPKKIYRDLKHMSYNPNKNVRLMRFDFHPTADGWAVSEVNSDVPGGFSESCILPEIANEYFPMYSPFGNVASSLLNSFKSKISTNGTVALVHATSYSDDRQVMQFLGDYFNNNGINTVFAGPDLIRWENKKAYSVVKGKEGELDGIIRFFPLEWLSNLPRHARSGYYDCDAICCNHPIAMLAQSKRLPLIWDNLKTETSVWKRLLPETINPKLIKSGTDNWIYKPALGRVGEGISIREVLQEKEFKKIEKAARRNPKDWIAQRMFKSQPLEVEGEMFHLCIGVFTVDGKFSGFYGRVSPYARIDDKAKDIPILVAKEV